ncbi:MAG: ricin-type beta-trefoil lectin domain protein [Pseudonocardiaceae bacterium]
MHYTTMCLDEQEEDVNSNPGNIGLWDCNGSDNQIWSEKTITANPTSEAKNLASHRSGKCATYRPGDYGTPAGIWLAPCGQDGQGWTRISGGDTYMFEAAQVPGMCMSATAQPVTIGSYAGYIGIELRSCATTSPLKDWRQY